MSRPCYFHRQIITSYDNFRILYEDEESISLVIKDVQSEDAGKYIITAENELGSDTGEMNLTVKGMPLNFQLPETYKIIFSPSKNY